MAYNVLTNEQALLLNKYAPWADRVDLASLMDEILTSTRDGIFSGSIVAGEDVTCRDLHVLRDAFVANSLQVGGGYGSTGVTVDTDGNLSADGMGDFSTSGVKTRRETVVSSISTGTEGEICYDDNYIYVCIATDTWRRVAFGAPW